MAEEYRHVEGPRVTPGPGNVICAGAVLTVDIVLGDGGKVHRRGTIGCDLLAGKYCLLLAP
jgi:UDP-3-O-[3-hydroxymyristoyl] glucosamine N-acyltransferase